MIHQQQQSLDDVLSLETYIKQVFSFYHKLLWFTISNLGGEVFSQQPITGYRLVPTDGREKKQDRKALALNNLSWKRERKTCACA